jgi:subtilisin family serine protease
VTGGRQSEAVTWLVSANGNCWPVVHLRDPARELTFAASASSANLRFGRTASISATGQDRALRFVIQSGHRRRWITNAFRRMTKLGRLRVAFEHIAGTSKGQHHYGVRGLVKSLRRAEMGCGQYPAMSLRGFAY